MGYNACDPRIARGRGAPTLDHGQCAKAVPMVWIGVPVMA